MDKEYLEVALKIDAKIARLKIQKQTAYSAYLERCRASKEVSKHSLRQEREEIRGRKVTQLLQKQREKGIAALTKKYPRLVTGVVPGIDPNTGEFYTSYGDWYDAIMKARLNPEQ